jgi:8-oxo-dGTP pyrophosphatase MutT (NUDIX family)
MIRAAGILIISKKGNALFLKRGPGGDNPGEWCFPGGRLEEGEDEITAAVRETLEETGGFKADPKKLVLWTRTVRPRSTTGAPPTPSPAEPQAPLAVIAAAATATEAAPVVLPGEEVDFTTFIYKVDEEFVPNVEKSGEHTAFAWAKVAEPPQPMHPGCQVALDRFGMNELGIARAMSEGQLTSPQRYGGFWLFNIRITGTGMAQRNRKLGAKLAVKDRKGKRVDANGYEIVRDEEYVYRNPQYYLTPEFLARCNGLPVVLHHPESLQMNGDDWEERAIGTVFLPYLKGEEVWGVAKIYDENAAEAMAVEGLSTSPGVVWNSSKLNVTTKIDGENLLLENDPSLMDHIAVCRQGVWDKGGPPAGVESIEARKDAIDMDKETFEKMLKEHQTNTDTAIKGILSVVEGLTAPVKALVARADSEDEEKAKAAKDRARKDAEEMKFTKRADADDDEEYKAKHDAEEEAMKDAFKACGDSDEEAAKKAADARKNAEEEDEKAAKDAEEEAKAAKDAAAGEVVAGLKKQLEDLQKKFDERAPAIQPKDHDPVAFGKAQSAFDEVCSALAISTPVPMAGESLLAYRKRGIVELKKYSTTFKDADVGVAAVDEGIFAPIERTVLSEALIAARSPASVPAGTLREVARTLPTGHKTTEFVGNPADWMADFAPSLRFANIQPHNANGVKH